MPDIGQPAPDFQLPNQDGRLRSLADYRGRTLVLYFYPKDMTPGCTQEACDVRDAYAAGDVPEGAVVVGVSPDSPKRHRTFIAKEGLNFELLSDEDHAVAAAYGAWGEKKLYGKTYEGVNRSTFVISPEGSILLALTNVKVPGHIKDVLAQVR